MESTREQRDKFRVDLFDILASNMEFIFLAMSATTSGMLPVRNAISIALAMMQMGVALAQDYPEIATVLRQAADEYDEDKGYPITTAASTKAVIDSYLKGKGGLFQEA